MQKIQKNANGRKKERKIVGQKKTKSNTLHNLKPQYLLDLLQIGQKPLRLDQILKILSVPRAEKKNIETMLYELAAQGKILRLRGGQWSASVGGRTFIGQYSVQRSGAGFVDMAKPEEDAKLQKQSSGISIFVHPSQAGEAWHGDIVRVALLPKPFRRKGKDGNATEGKRQEGKIVAVVERKAKEIMVRVESNLNYEARQSSRQIGFSRNNRNKRHAVKSLSSKNEHVGNYLFCKPCDVRFSFTIRLNMDSIPSSFSSSLIEKSLLLVRPEKQISSNLWSAELISTHGQEDDVAVQEALVKINHQCPSEFPQDALAQAEVLPQSPNPEDYVNRKDLRELPFVTIDGETARDFDDAIYVQILENGDFDLSVAVADVTHYVPQDSPLDNEAKARANSWYFPCSVEPMFPESLSNGLCSLNPHVDRLVMVAQMHFDSRGKKKKCKFYSAVINSFARLTYTQVKNAVVDNDIDAQEQMKSQKNGQVVFSMLQNAYVLAQCLAKRRVKKGTLDFNRPDVQYSFDEERRIINISRKEEHFAHKIIEECMIAANESVAEFLSEIPMPLLYRVHPEPDAQRLDALFRTLSSTSLVHDIPPKAKAKDLQKVLHASIGSEQEFLVGRLALRTMAQARYQPENTGHFGLASECYCHFTSPIRRYADMVVHRALKYALCKQSKSLVDKDKSTYLPDDHHLLALGDNINAIERTSMEAEREIAKRLAILVLQGHEGQKYTGIIGGISDFGLFVELDDMPVEGLVHIKNLGDDFFEFDPEKQELIGLMSGARYYLGQKVEVRLVEASLARLEINFKLLSLTHMGLPHKQAAKMRKSASNKKSASLRRNRLRKR